PTLFVSRERDYPYDPLYVELVEAGLAEPYGRALTHEPLRARAGVDPGRLHADETPRALRRGSREPDQRDHLLRGEAGDRCLALERVAREDLDLRPKRPLPLDDVRRDVLGQILDEQRLPDHDLLDGFREQLGEPRHVDALARRLEIDGAIDLGRDQLLGVAI